MSVKVTTLFWQVIFKREVIFHTSDQQETQVVLNTLYLRKVKGLDKEKLLRKLQKKMSRGTNTPSIF